LHLLSDRLKSVEWEGNALQVSIFDAARLTPIDQPSAFKAIYRVLLDRDNGPKAGNLLSFLDRDFVSQRCAELPVDKPKFWEETGIAPDAFTDWLAKEQPKIKSLSAKLAFLAPNPEARANAAAQGMAIVEFLVTMPDGKIHCRRVFFGRPEASDRTAEAECEQSARNWINGLEKRSGLTIPVSTQVWRDHQGPAV
jgi:lysyl-tRNA synthetase, class I